jgi:hypothetical protein
MWVALFCAVCKDDLPRSPDTHIPVLMAFFMSALVLPSFGLVVRFAYRHSMESLILAQDERWRRA